MANTLTHRSGVNVLRRSKAPGEAELHALFQLLPNPALLLDTSKEKIILANGPFLQLTAFSPNELEGRSLDSLVNGLPSHQLATDEVLSVMLERRSKTPLAVNLQVRPLDPAGQWLSLIFDTQDRRSKDLLARMDEIVNALIELNRFKDGESMRQTLERSLATVCKLLDITAAGIYRIDRGDAMMWRAAESGEAGVLPNTIAPTDLSRLSQTYVWHPGLRVQTDLHRAARVQMARAMSSADRVSVPLNTRCSIRWEIPPRSSGSILEPVSTQMPTATERTQGSDSVTTRTPFGSTVLR